MAKRWDKHGQFYLIAALAIITLIIGFAILTNSLEKREFNKVNYLKEELEIEGEKVVDYGIYTGDTKIEYFTKNFSNYAGKDVNIYYIVGDTTDMQAYTHNESGKIAIPFTNIENKTVNVTVDDREYKFKITPGINFYFIIFKKANEEKYIATNKVM